MVRSSAATGTPPRTRGAAAGCDGWAESPAATQVLASSRSKSVGFPVFPDHPGHVEELRPVGRHLDPDLVTDPVQRFPPGFVAGLDLALDEALQKAAAGVALLLRAQVQPLQGLVGNGDHHLGHGMSIYGIA